MEDNIWFDNIDNIEEIIERLQNYKKDLTNNIGKLSDELDDIEIELNTLQDSRSYYKKKYKEKEVEKLANAGK